ncbi:MAG: hypothetical protein QXG39_02580 [Candidatus Aenigmatarchaeota archaeon]
MKKMWYWIKFQLFDTCPECGSSNVIYRGFEFSNRRIDCKNCGKETRIWSL